MTLSIMKLCHCADCHCAKCCDLFIGMLNVVMLSAIMLRVVRLNVMMLSVTAPYQTVAQPLVSLTLSPFHLNNATERLQNSLIL
jgi:hypothetical protein